jgi:hypothetical protein
MNVHRLLCAATILGLAALAVPAVAAPPAPVQGSFVVGGTPAQLRHARAMRLDLDKGKPGFALLLSEVAAEGDIRTWQTADPKEKGSFIFLLLEQKGTVWIAEIGHSAGKKGRFGVVTEVVVQGFSAENGMLKARVHTGGEQEFFEDRYRIDLEVAAPIDK